MALLRIGITIIVYVFQSHRKTERIKIYMRIKVRRCCILTIDLPSMVRLEHFIKDTNDHNSYCIHVRFKFRILAIQCSRWRRKQWYFNLIKDYIYVRDFILRLDKIFKKKPIFKISSQEQYFFCFKMEFSSIILFSIYTIPQTYIGCDHIIFIRVLNYTRKA